MLSWNVFLLRISLKFLKLFGKYKNFIGKYQQFLDFLTFFATNKLMVSAYSVLIQYVADPHHTIAEQQS